MLKDTSKATLLVLALIAGGLTLLGCSSPNSSQTGDGATTSQPAQPTPAKSAFESDLQFIRNGQFSYVWVFSRADGKQLDRDDAAFLRKIAPQVVDWVTTDEGKRVIGGTNFDLEKGGMPELRKRFVVEDYTGK